MKQTTDPRVQGLRHQYSPHIWCFARHCNVVMQSLLFMSAVKVKEATTALSRIIRARTQKITPHQRRYRKGRSLNQKQRLYSPRKSHNTSTCLDIYIEPFVYIGALFTDKSASFIQTTGDRGNQIVVFSAVLYISFTWWLPATSSDQFPTGLGICFFFSPLYYRWLPDL